MIQFRNGFYADVRVEDRSRTVISYKAGKLEEMRNRREQQAFLRVYDGKLHFLVKLDNTPAGGQSIQAKVQTRASLTEGDWADIADTGKLSLATATGLVSGTTLLSILTMPPIVGFALWLFGR